MSFADAISTITRSGAAGDSGRTETDGAQVRALAEQFESMLLAQMLKEMKQAMSPDAEDQGLGGQMIGDTIGTELAQALGQTHSLGLSALMQKVFESRVAASDAAHAGHTHSTETVERSPHAAAAPAAITDASVAPKAAGYSSAAVVTSQFGWRTDPLNGAHKFHAGQDLRAAYGQDVRAATDGVVTFAGEKPGYGLIVVVSHGSGLETRYAHLSAAEVAQGDRIHGGDLIARSGQSGRVTGPHLHFEVRQDGRPVDPASVAGLLPVIGPTRGMSAD